MRLWESVKDFFALLLLTIIGAVVSAAFFLLKIIPDRERREREAAKERAKVLWEDLRQAQRAREEKTRQQLAEIWEENRALAAEAEKDSVSVANRLIAERQEKK
jgi:hypothetical protein